MALLGHIVDGSDRIGLPMQLLHDGRTLRHTLLRLSVFIEAPRAAIDTVTAGHEIVRHLVGNGRWQMTYRGGLSDNEITG